MYDENETDERILNSLIQRQTRSEGVLEEVVLALKEMRDAMTKTTSHDGPTATVPIASVYAAKYSKLPDIKEFDGNSKNFTKFEIQLEAFIRAQPNRFQTDLAKLDYVGARLIDKALDWFTSMRLMHKKTPMSSMENFSEFWNTFQLAFKDPNEEFEAENELFLLKQGSMPIRQFIGKFEMVRAK